MKLGIVGLLVNYVHQCDRHDEKKVAKANQKESPCRPDFTFGQSLSHVAEEGEKARLLPDTAVVASN